MTLCNYLDNYGPPPTFCPDLQEYLNTVIYMAGSIDYLKTASSALPPTWYDLEVLWAPCSPPSIALVQWYNSTNHTWSQWLKYRPNGYWVQLSLVGPIAFWRLNELAGLIAYDISGNFYNGTYIGPTVAGTIGPDGAPAPTFDGLNDYMDVYSAGLAGELDGEEGTYSGWFRVTAGSVWTDANFRMLFSFRPTTDANHIFIMKLGTGEILFQASMGGTTVSVLSAIQTTTVWFHVAATWSASDDKIELLINDVSIGTAAGLGVWVGPVLTATIGSLWDGSSNFWSGAIALNSVWDAPLAPAQLSDLATV